MAKFDTHKNTSTGKRLTIERKIRRAAKRSVSTVDTLAEVARTVNARYISDGA